MPAGFATVRTELGVLVCALAGLLLAACSSAWRVEAPAPPRLLAPEIDSVVVRGFEAAPGIEINSADVALFGKHLRDALDEREELRTFDDPPTKLPNTVIITGRLNGLTVTERDDGGLVLRTIELDARLQVMPVEGEQPLHSVRRVLAWQKLYPGTVVTALAFDLEIAVRELTTQLAQAVAPQPVGETLVLRDGSERPGSWGGAHPAIIKGNRFAVARLYDRAKLAWRRVLIDPAPDSEANTYQIIGPTVNQLRAAGVGDDVLDRIAPLVGESPLPLVRFRNKLREHAGEVLPNEGVILTLADTRAAYAHRNLAAAHANLGNLYAVERRGDLAAFHLAYAWAHDPDPALLERWHAVQSERNVLPGDLSEQEALRLYLRIPPPRTALLQPGSFDRSVLPPPAFRAEDDAAQEGGDPTTPGRAAGSGPRDTTGAAGVAARAPAVAVALPAR